MKIEYVGLERELNTCVVFCILAPPRPTSLDGVLGGCVTTRQTQIAVHGVLCCEYGLKRQQNKYFFGTGVLYNILK